MTSGAAIARDATESVTLRRIAVGCFAIVAILPLLLNGVWLAALGIGLAYALALLSYTFSAGLGGMIWLCQITFAGMGAFTTAELATRAGWPVLAALLAGGLVTGIVGAIIGFLTVRLGDLYIALVTLTFGLLVENLVFQLSSLYNNGAGVNVQAPSFATSPRGFAWLAYVIFVLFALLFVTVKRSTFGLAIGAVRWSEGAARTTGLSVLWTKVSLSAVSALVVGVAGGLLAVYARGARPDSYSTFLGLIWLAVVVTLGVQSSSGALLAGLTFSFFPFVISNYLPAKWDEVPAVLFGLGAVMVAKHPEGSVAMNGRLLENALKRRRQRRQVGAGELGMATPTVTSPAGALVEPIGEGGRR
jgi:branched-chain amino acid transport system permease protein